MEIEITVYKESGKFYTSCIAKSDINIPLWDDKFNLFVKENNPADIGEGFITTENLGEGFHSYLFKYEDLYKS